MRSLARLDRCAADLATNEAGVVTHGEPHPGNLIHTSNGLALVDWDTVALARPERDLWMFDDGTATAIDAYRKMTGVELDREALAAYRLLWALADVASFITQLRGEHQRTVDAERALVALDQIFSGEEPSPYAQR